MAALGRSMTGLSGAPQDRPGVLDETWRKTLQGHPQQLGTLRERGLCASLTQPSKSFGEESPKPALLGPPSTTQIAKLRQAALTAHLVF